MDTLVPIYSKACTKIQGQVTSGANSIAQRYNNCRRCGSLCIEAYGRRLPFS
jgi:hypothetical protein